MAAMLTVRRQSRCCTVALGLWSAALCAQPAAPPASSPLPSATAPNAPNAPNAAVAAAPPPADSFFRKPDLAAAKLSPSGRWLAVQGGSATGRDALAVFDASGVEPPRVIVNFRDIDVGRFDWVNDERLVYDLLDRERGSGDAQDLPGLFSVKRDGTEQRQLIQTRHAFVTELRVGGGSRVLDVRHTLLQVPVQSSMTGDDAVVVVGERQWGSGGDLTAVVPKLLNVVNGRTSPIALGTPAHTTGWLFDRNGAPRVAVVTHEGRTQVHWRADPALATREAWTELLAAPSLALPWTPQLVDAAGRLYVRTASGAVGEQELRRFDFKTGQPEALALVSTPGFDFAGGLVTGQEGALIGVRAVTDAESTVWLDARMQAVQAAVDRRLPGRVNRLSCRQCRQPDGAVLVESWSDQNPGEFWLWRGEPAAPTQWTRVGLRNKRIEPQAMATVEFARFKARDGRSIPVWVTTPPASTAAGGKPPAVLLAHGGPWLRNGNWAWAALPQFLASRGYVVIEPEFRGSQGYGLAHFRAGWKQWGQAMQDDLADAVAWAGSQGLIDSRRVCIAGASYGGYAALMGLVRHPGVYRCAAAWLAVTEPALLFRWGWDSDANDETRLFSLPQLLGDPVADAAMLRAVSPVQQAARIQAPVLLAYGELDRRVPLEHGERMRAALRAAGQEPQWVVYPGEGHGWQRMDHRLDFAARLEKFLAENLR